jgi:hypothetical protein
VLALLLPELRLKYSNVHGVQMSEGEVKYSRQVRYASGGYHTASM